MRTTTDRSGFVLVFCLLLAMVMSLLVAGMLVLAERETAIAAAADRLADARARAEAGALRAFTRWSTRRVDDLAIGESRIVLADSTATVRAERLAPELFLLRSEARLSVDAGTTSLRSAGLMVRVITPPALDAAAAAVVEEAAALQGGSVSGLDPCRQEDVAGLAGPSPTLAPGVILVGDPPFRQGPQPSSPLATLPLQRLADIILTEPAGSPRPVTAGTVCEPDSWNWGSPDPMSPCHDTWPLILAPGDLRLEGGTGQGILVVHGDLAISGGFTFRGILMVGGRLLMDHPGLRIAGHVRARHLDLVSGLVQYDACAVRAAAGGPALDRAFRPGTRWWVPLF